jgi:HD-GYP domain-containing protein (c-di-GMP phosphodiesterase class II)
MIIAASLHSIGKLFIPKEIYYKSNILTKEEIDMLKAIPYFSHSILSSIFGFDDIAKLCSLYNERLDGTGTPYELDASNLSLKDRLLAILVIYQALLEEKVYRKAFCHEEAIEILKKEASANKLDLSIVEDLDRKYQIKK